MEAPMTITDEQRLAIERSGAEPVRVEDPQTGSAYYLIRADVFEKLRELVAIEGSDRSLYEFEDFRPIDENP
jgi:hypothetical protein